MDVPALGGNPQHSRHVQPGQNSNISSSLALSSSAAPSEVNQGSLLPPFSARPYTHLPTPQSPITVGRFLHDFHSPESPIPHPAPSQPSAPPSVYPNRSITPRASTLDHAARTVTDLQQCVTPEPSPCVPRSSPQPFQLPATPRFLHTPSTSQDFSTPKAVKLQAPIPVTPSPAAFSSFPATTPSAQPPPLSSPFMGHASVCDRQTKTLLPPLLPQPVGINDGFAQAQPVAITARTFGGEIDRIRLAMEEERRELESQRPEYLVRSKRPSSQPLDDHPDPVAIMETPMRGRRITLFQETSEESFENSLMAGGYGLYRTSDWSTQPQPAPLVVNNPTGVPKASKTPEVTEEQPLTDKEAKKRRRLEAFQLEASSGSSRLFAVELEGKGRVLYDIPAEESVRPPTPDVSPSKKRAGNRRKKKGAEPPVVDRRTLKGDNVLERPNWPDSEFPWRLRSEERAELVRAQESERLKWIERFLDRDTDSESDDEDESGTHSDGPGPTGGGKTVSVAFQSGPLQQLGSTAQGTVAADPADALMALIAKRSVRTLSYRQQVRRRNGEYSDEESSEFLCLCRGTDDGRELVQCDACQTWYHLECLGIRDVSELGREEDPWFCRRCNPRSRSPSAEPDEIPSSEPTFVPTDEDHFVHRSSDATLSSVHASPNWPIPSRVPKTPTRSFQYPDHQFRTHTPASYDPKANPTTPQRGWRYLQPPRAMDGAAYVEDMPLDLTSTPSRGIKFTAPFTTPKSAGWPSKPLFNSPSRNNMRGPVRSMGSLGSLAGVLDYPHSLKPDAYDQTGSPGRRNQSHDFGNRRRGGRSRSRNRASYSGPASILEESPVVRSSGSYR